MESSEAAKAAAVPFAEFAETMTAIEKLLSIGSEPLSARPEIMPESLKGHALGSELFSMLQQKNGFYAFESALHVFPIRCDSTDEMDLETWNSDTLWRKGYPSLAQGLLFFGEDIGQDQFCFSHQGVLRFKSETGEVAFMADSLEKWAGLILSNYRFETGWPLPMSGKRTMELCPTEGGSCRKLRFS